jgi:hypothetical protein
VNERHSDTGTFYRSRLTNSLVFLITGFAALEFLVNLVRQAEKPEPSGVLLVMSTILFVAFLVPTLRYPRHGVVATRDQLVIRNILKTHIVDWDDVDRFELGRYDPWPKVGIAVLRNGKRIPMTGVQWRPATPYAERAVAALNQERGSRRHTVTSRAP